MKTKSTDQTGNRNRISLRLDDPIAERFEKVVTASRRSKTSIIEECLEVMLPKLERQYSRAV